MKHGKKYRESAKLVDSTKLYEVGEACDLVCKTAAAKFDETVELHVRLGVDSRHADQQVRGAVVLPNGTGKTVRTLVFTKGEKQELIENKTPLELFVRSNPVISCVIAVFMLAIMILNVVLWIRINRIKHAAQTRAKKKSGKRK